MRAAMERQACPYYSGLTRGQQQAVAAKILEADALPSQFVDHDGKCGKLEQLTWQQVMPLQRRVIADAVLAVDRTKPERGMPAPWRDRACLRLLDATPSSALDQHHLLFVQWFELKLRAIGPCYQF